MNKSFILLGRCSGKTALIRSKLKTGYQVVYDDNCAGLYFIDIEKPSITLVDEAYKDISPNKYEHLVKISKKLKKNK